jgi:DNA-binding XRE family transcriptional regulator
MALTETTPTPWVPEDSFGARLAQIRQTLGWNVKIAAETCGLNDQSWRNWEDGKRCRDLLDVAAKIANATGCDRQWLLMGQNLKDTMGPDLEIIVGGGEGGEHRPKLHLVPSGE